ncbi:MAG TPA: hypothetical protein VMH83_09430, partial [Candidatus Acidoferrum sp.]|nr:hypothetical protein [Candidatus Acidoferrum sp.]
LQNPNATVNGSGNLFVWSNSGGSTATAELLRIANNGIPLQLVTLSDRSLANLVVDSQGKLLAYEYNNSAVNQIFRVDSANGNSTLLAGSYNAVSHDPNNFTSTSNLPDGNGSNAQLGFIAAMALDGNDNLYVYQVNNTLRRITPAGDVTTLTDFFVPWFSHSIATVSGDKFYFTEQNSISVSWAGNKNLTIAGTRLNPGNQAMVDGFGYQARFNSISASARANDGTIYLSDVQGQQTQEIATLRKVEFSNNSLGGTATLPVIGDPTSITISATDLTNTVIKQIQLLVRPRHDLGQQVLINPQLQANDYLTNGTVTGTITGVPGAAAKIAAIIGDNSTLNYVVVGKGASIPATVHIGAGVKFETADLIPVGVDLGAALGVLANTYGLTRIDVTGNLISAGASVFNQLRSLSAAFSATPGLLLTAAGNLNFDYAQHLYALAPIKAVQAASGTAPGMTMNSDNSLSFVTAQDHAITAVPVIEEIDQLNTALGANNSLRISASGSMTFVSTTTGSTLQAARPELAAAEVPATTTSGLTTNVSTETKGLALLNFVFTHNGKTYRQRLLPAAYDDVFLAQQAATIPGLKLGFDNDGHVIVTTAGGSKKYMFNYQVQNTANSSIGIKPAGDLNGDGTSDLMVIYPDHKQQALYALP